MNAVTWAVAGYLVLQFAIGIWASRWIENETDYLVAGRSLGMALATFSIFATWFGAETVVGSAGATYEDGVSLTTAEPFGYGLCLVLMGAVFAVPLWKRGLTTLADLFRQRYGTSVERAAALILIPGSILWAAAQVRAFGQVLSSVTVGLDVDLAIGIAAGVTIVYTVLGGLLADAVTDLIQGVVVTVGLIAVLVAVSVHLGGAGPTAAVIVDSGRIHLGVVGSGAGGAGGAGSIMATLEEWAIPICGSVVATELVGRVIATKSPGVARGSSLLAGGLYIVVGLVPVTIGLLGVSVVPGLTEAEQVIPVVARELLLTALFALFAGSLISAILSTVDSTLLIASGLLSHNVIVPLTGTTEEGRKVFLARGGVVVFGIFAYILALRAQGVLALVEQASAFGSAGTLVTVVFALFTPLGDTRTALATLGVGMVSYLVASYGGYPYPFLLSLGLSLVTYLAGAVLGRLVPEESLKEPVRHRSKGRTGPAGRAREPSGRARWWNS